MPFIFQPRSILPLVSLSLIAFAAPSWAVTILTPGASTTTQIFLTYTHTVNSCAGGQFTFGPCIESVSPSLGSYYSVPTPSVSLAALVPNAILSAATLYLIPGATTSSDIQNSWSANGSVSGSTNNPQGQLFPSYRITSFSFGAATFSPNSSSVDLLALGLGAALVDGGDLSATGSAAAQIYAYDGWTGTGNFFYTQNRTLTRSQTFSLQVSVTYSDPGPEVPEPGTALSAALALCVAGLKLRSQRVRADG